MVDTVQVDVLNTALFQVGKPPVDDITEASLRQNAAAMRMVKQMHVARDHVLSRHGWLSALEYATLTETSLPGDVNWKYPHTYLLPGHALRCWEVYTPNLMQPFWAEIDWIAFGEIGPPIIQGERWEQSTIDTDLGARVLIRSDLCNQIAVSFVRRCNWMAMDRPLRRAISFELAALCAWNITADRGVAADLRKAADREFDIAVGYDATQQGGQHPISGSITSRLRLISR